MLRVAGRTFFCDGAVGANPQTKGDVVGSMSGDAGYKICPSCEEEYLPQVEVCVECGVALVLDSELCSTEPEAVAPVESPFAGQEELVCIRIASAGWLQRLAKGFEAEGIPYRLEMLSASLKGRSKLAARGELPDSMGLYVRPRDATRATQIDQEHLQREIPGIEEFTENAGELKCPACAAALGEAEEICSACGLSFV